jgi:hypothetical protein
MSIEQQTQWISTEEYQREWRRLREARVPLDAPEVQELMRRVSERDDYLYEQYGKPHYDTHYGRWIAVSTDGEVIIRDTSSEVHWAAVDAFGSGNFAIRKLAEFPGHQL